MILYHGFKIKSKISGGTKRVLRKLKKDGMAVLFTDDGPGQLIKAEIIKIADELSLSLFEVSPWELLVVRMSFYQKNVMNLSEFPEKEYPKY